MMVASPPANFQPYMSNPRLPTAPPYERLVLVSSRVADVMRVVRAAESRPNVAVVAYDWSMWTLQELLGHVRRVLAGGKVMSLAVVAPGKNPGGVGLLEGYQTTVDKLSGKAELAQFWKALASCVTTSSAGDGGRVDLIASRVNEMPTDGAALLMALWQLTSVPFAASDNAQAGYKLSTFQHNPATNEVSLAATDVQAVDIYFDRAGLQGAKTFAPPPAAHTPPLPAGAPPPSALSPNPFASAAQIPQASTAQPAPGAFPLRPPFPSPFEAAAQHPYQSPGITPQQSLAAQQVGSSPLKPGASAATPGGPSQPGQQQQWPPAAEAVLPVKSAPPPALPIPQRLLGPVPSQQPPPAPSTDPYSSGLDIFTKFFTAVRQSGLSVEDVFKRHDRDGSGALTQEEVLNMVQSFVPAATQLDARHFKAMLDVDRSDTVTLDELRTSMSDATDVHAAVRAMRDQSNIMLRLYEYVMENEQILRKIFDQYDANQSGSLEHNEIQQLVAMIPGLTAPEVKFVCAYLYQNDPNKDGRLTYEELAKLARLFVKRLQAAQSQPTPTQPPPPGEIQPSPSTQQTIASPQPTGLAPSLAAPSTPLQPLHRPGLEPLQSLQRPGLEPLQPLQRPVLEPLQPLQRPGLEPLQRPSMQPLQPLQGAAGTTPQQPPPPNGPQPPPPAIATGTPGGLNGALGGGAAAPPNLNASMGSAGTPAVVGPNGLAAAPASMPAPLAPQPASSAGPQGAPAKPGTNTPPASLNGSLAPPPTPPQSAPASQPPGANTPPASLNGSLGAPVAPPPTTNAAINAPPPSSLNGSLGAPQPASSAGLQAAPATPGTNTPPASLNGSLGAPGPAPPQPTPVQPRPADGFSGAPAVGAVEMLVVPTPARRGLLSPVNTPGP